MKSSFDRIHLRDYDQEHKKLVSMKNKGFFETTREQFENNSPLIFAGIVGLEGASLQAGKNFFTSNKVNLSADLFFNSIRKLENGLPLFNIPLRSSQLGDMLSPFVSTETLNWQFGGVELLDSNKNVPTLKKDFQFLNELVGRDLAPEISKDATLSFEKTGSVYGNIYLTDLTSRKTIAEDVFMMQRPSNKTGALSSIWDAGKRPTNFYQPLSQAWEEPLSDLGFSKESIYAFRKAGGVAKAIVGETTHEFFKGMNRFLKEPIPGLNMLLDWGDEGELLGKKIKDLGFAGQPLDRLFKNLSLLETDKKDSLGRLPRLLRPYVHEGFWTKSAGRMAVALSAKGAMYSTVLPSLYSALDYSREQTANLPFPVTGALYGGIGLGLGSLIKSQDFNKGIFRGTKLLTNTQIGGALAGLAVGTLPIFDRGISAGLGSLYGNLNILGSRAWETIGGQDAKRRQEELFPGMTNPFTGLGFVMGGGFVGYFNSEIGTSRGLLSTIRNKPFELNRYTQAEILERIQKGTVSDHLSAEVLKAFRSEQSGKTFSVREAARVLRGEIETASTVTGLVASSYKKLDSTPEFLKRISTVEGSEELASRLFTHLDEISSTAQKALREFDPEYLMKSSFGKMISRAKDTLGGRPSFTRGALKGGLAFLGIAELGAIAAGPLGGNFSPVNLVPGFLISMTGGGSSAKETEEIFTGKKEVAVRKGRWWSLGSCLSEDAKLYIDQLGNKISAKEIKVGQLVLNSEGTQSKILQIWKRKYVGQIYKIYTNDYENPLIITGNHIVPYLEFCGNNKIKKYDVPKFGRIDKLKVKDAVRLPNLSSTSVEQYEKFGEYILDEDLGYLLGVYLAEGCTSQNKRIDLTHNIKEKYIYEQLEYICNKLGLSYKLKIRNNTAKSLIFNTKFTKLISDQMYTNHSIDSTVYGKRIPDQIFKSPRNVQLGFLKGWIDGDGYYKGNTALIKTVSIGLKNQLVDLVYKLDLVPRVTFEVINKYYAPQTKQYTSCETHNIYVVRISFSNNPQGVCFEGNNKYIAIRKIETEYYDGDVYDFEIDHEDHLLVSNFLVHNSPWEGTKVSYHRKHRAVLMQSDAEDNALYGSRAEKLDYDPILHPLKALFSSEFKYHRDMRLSEISPTPLSSRMFADVPILGDMLASTIGEIIKPTKAIRANEWKGLGGLVNPAGDLSFHEMRHAPPIGDLGGVTQYTARDQTSIYSTMRDTFKRLNEQAGLRGFMLSNLMSSFGYEERLYDPVIERGDSLISNRAKFWSLNLGDPLGTTEAARRYLAKDRNTYYNPLTNMAPSWLPKDNYFLDFKHGNYFNKVQEGWLRLPGAGYETLNPELQGLHPENYSVGHKYKILSDVAYGSNEYLFAKEQAKKAIASGTASKRDLELIAIANEQIDAKRIKRSFRDYQFKNQMSKEQEFTVMGVAEDGSIITAETGKRQLSLAGLNMSMAAFTRKKLEEENYKTVKDAERAASEARQNAISELRNKLKPGTKIRGHIQTGDAAYSGATTEIYIPELNESIKSLGAEVNKDSTFSSQLKYNSAQRFLGKFWETYTHNADLPITPGMALNKIAPFQPHAKFIKRLTPIELYAQTRVYGRELQMWQNYKEDFIDTAVNDVKSKLFGDFIPNKVRYNRTMIEYFDKLKWMKYHMLEEAANSQSNQELSEYFKQRKKQTMYGADPYRGYIDIFRALPGTERDYYREFVNEEDPENQQRILDLAPDAMKRIYIAQWQNKTIKALSHKAEAGIASNTEKLELRNLYKLRESEGFVSTTELQNQYKNETRGSDISYADWVRMKELKEYFKAFKMPKPNFVGFDPRVDLEDIKLKVAKQEGIDIHDIGLWDQQEASIARKPYVDAGASLLQDWSDSSDQTELDFEAQVRRTIRELSSKISLMPLSGNQNKVIMSASDTREIEIKRHLQKGMF